MSRYVFRMHALRGDVPGVKKASCYFVNDDDEIRSIENPKYYFKYFINRTERYNERQRENLGVPALCINDGHGGINAGSCVDFVKYVHSQAGRPAVILANCGQLRWNRRQGRAMTRVSWDSQTRESAVHDAPLYEPVVNTVEGNRDQKAHISYLLSTVVPALCKEGGQLDVIATPTAR
ncbi:hypothetical protein VE04_06414, partial [Pseudogymnoascus sp. 24MN13]